MGKNTKVFVLFLVLSGVLFFCIGLQDYVFIRPQSIHQWRQTVCLNITLNYAKQDNTFLQPETNLLNADNSTTGIAQGEFPIFYYTLGKIWKVIGVHEWTYRLAVFATFFLALWCVALFLYEQTKHLLISITVPLFFLATPVAAYYSVAFLMDIVGVSVVIIGWFGVYRYFTTGKNVWLWFFGIMFSLAGLLKVTSLISVFALGGYCAAVWFSWSKNIFEPQKWHLKTIGVLTAVTMLNVAWYAFAIHYNEVHNAWFTENGIYPIWELTEEMWLEIKDWFINYWSFQYAPQMTYVLFALTIVYVLFSKSKWPAKSLVVWVGALTTLGALMYVMLWFQVFNHHDYYVLVLYVVPLLFALYASVHLADRLTKMGKNLFGFMLLIALCFATYFTGNQVSYRLYGWPNNDGHNTFEAYFDLEPYLRNELNLNRLDKVIAYPDESVCISLYLCDQKGWQVSKNSDVDAFHYFKGVGAEYLLVNDSSFYNIPNISDLAKEKIGQHKSITIYKLPKN